MNSPIKPIVNCHTHVFIGENIPPQIAKTFLPWPFYKLFTIPFILGLCRFWFLNRKLSPYGWQFRQWYRKLFTLYYEYRVLIRRTRWTKIIFLDILNPLIAYHGIIYLLDWITRSRQTPGNSVGYNSIALIDKLRDHHLIIEPPLPYFKLLVILFTFIFIATGRKIILFLCKQAWSFLKFLPDRQTIRFLARYINIGRFAYYKSSALIFKKLQDQYPAGTCFVILPMDMEFMDAGKIKPVGSFRKQMDDLNLIRSAYPAQIFPFVFVDPRRKDVNGQRFLDWTSSGHGEVTLNDCFVKEFIEQKAFSGFKIYPALGYYPFDEALLPLWKYAADKGLPITTHCIRETIFFRGPKNKTW